MVDENLHVSLSYRGYRVPLPERFRSVHGCKLSNKKCFRKYPPYLRSKAEEMDPILKELNDI